MPVWALIGVALTWQANDDCIKHFGMSIPESLLRLAQKGREVIRDINDSMRFEWSSEFKTHRAGDLEFLLSVSLRSDQSREERDPHEEEAKQGPGLPSSGGAGESFAVTNRKSDTSRMWIHDAGVHYAYRQSSLPSAVMMVISSSTALTTSAEDTVWQSAAVFDAGLLSPRAQLQMYDREVLALPADLPESISQHDTGVVLILNRTRIISAVVPPNDTALPSWSRNSTNIGVLAEVPVAVTELLRRSDGTVTLSLNTWDRLLRLQSVQQEQVRRRYAMRKNEEVGRDEGDADLGLELEERVTSELVLSWDTFSLTMIHMVRTTRRLTPASASASAACCGPTNINLITHSTGLLNEHQTTSKSHFVDDRRNVTVTDGATTKSCTKSGREPHEDDRERQAGMMVQVKEQPVLGVAGAAGISWQQLQQDSPAVPVAATGNNSTTPTRTPSVEKTTGTVILANAAPVSFFSRLFRRAQCVSSRSAPICNRMEDVHGFNVRSAVQHFRLPRSTRRIFRFPRASKHRHDSTWTTGDKSSRNNAGSDQASAETTSSSSNINEILPSPRVTIDSAFTKQDPLQRESLGGEPARVALLHDADMQRPGLLESAATGRRGPAHEKEEIAVPLAIAAEERASEKSSSPLSKNNESKNGADDRDDDLHDARRKDKAAKHVFKDGASRHEVDHDPSMGAVVLDDSRTTAEMRKPVVRVPEITKQHRTPSYAGMVEEEDGQAKRTKPSRKMLQHQQGSDDSVIFLREQQMQQLGVGQRHSSDAEADAVASGLKHENMSDVLGRDGEAVKLDHRSGLYEAQPAAARAPARDSKHTANRDFLRDDNDNIQEFQTGWFSFSRPSVFARFFGFLAGCLVISILVFLGLKSQKQNENLKLKCEPHEVASEDQNEDPTSASPLLDSKSASNGNGADAAGSSPRFQQEHRQDPAESVDGRQEDEERTSNGGNESPVGIISAPDDVDDHEDDDRQRHSISSTAPSKAKRTTSTSDEEQLHEAAHDAHCLEDTPLEQRSTKRTLSKYAPGSAVVVGVAHHDVAQVVIHAPELDEHVDAKVAADHDVELLEDLYHGGTEGVRVNNFFNNYASSPSTWSSGSGDVRSRPSRLQKNMDAGAVKQWWLSIAEQFYAAAGSAAALGSAAAAGGPDMNSFVDQDDDEDLHSSAADSDVDENEDSCMSMRSKDESEGYVSRTELLIGRLPQMYGREGQEKTITDTIDGDIWSLSWCVGEGETASGSVAGVPELDASRRPSRSGCRVIRYRQLGQSPAAFAALLYEMNEGGSTVLSQGIVLTRA
ncbi:unnamed protein product [Amoebophrya sp. A120]|nr:unnamed protein product [Amoebophrya sp. A120]|eukprot:GSA120T00018368001.1